MPDRREPAQARRFLVTWRDGEKPPGLHAVGALLADGGNYTFRYLVDVLRAPGFRPFPGLGDRDKLYRSSTLFLFFADRVMDRRRPEYNDYLRALDLPPHASLEDVLARSEGVLKGDRVAVVEEPSVGQDGSTTHVFVVRGLRFAVPDPVRREALLADLGPGVPVSVRDDTSNPVSPEALHLMAPSGEPFGWVPDALVHYVRSVVATPGSTVVVQRRNGPDLPPHIRLLVRVSGFLPAGVPALPPLGQDVPVPF